MSQVQVVPSGGCHDCGGRCPYKLHVKDGKVIRMEPDDELRACLRGYAYRQRVYAPDRLTSPLKRVGARGEGKFEKISWDEALDSVARELKRIKETYGSSAILSLSGSGTPGHIPHMAVDRMLRAFGGCSLKWASPSAEGSVHANRATFGTLVNGNTRDDLVNSRLVIMWGWNPMVTIYSTNTSFQLIKAKEAGARFISVDPRFTESAAVLAEQWIPLRPGTDVAMAVAMAHVMIKENLQDQKFLDRYTVGFDNFKAYVTGQEDGVVKSPAWAEAITGAPAATIEKLARDYATTRPAALIPGYGPGRTAYGEQFHRAVATLAAMTGNIGIHGGNAAGFERGRVGPMVAATRGAAGGRPRSPTERQAPSLSGSLDSKLRSRTRIHNSKVWDAILFGRSGGYPYDIKMVYMVAGNWVNQYLDTNKAVQALKQVESVIVHEQFMTPTARFADIILPANTHWERNDYMRPWLSGAYYLWVNKAIDSLGESKSELDICRELAPRLGIHDYPDKTDEELSREIIASTVDTSKDITDINAFKREGIHRIKLDGPVIAFKEQIEDPEHNPFPTPSGKIEIYCQRLADLNDPQMPPIPKYIEPWESINDPLVKEYPLQLVTFHFLSRAHSCFDNIPHLKEVERQTVWLNSSDARVRGIKDGDEVFVLNDRGKMIIPARVTSRIMPGVVAIGEGAWYDPDEKGIDRGGCANVLTKTEQSPGGAFPSNTVLVQVKKA